MTDQQFRWKLMVMKDTRARRLATGWIAGLNSLGVSRALLIGEAEGEPEAGQEAILWVVRNRAAHPGWWGETAYQVMLWPHQFSCFWTDYIRRYRAMERFALHRDTPWARQVKGWYERILEAGGEQGVLALDPTFGSTHYFNPAVVDPAWAGRLHWTVRIGHHQFAREGA